MHTRNGMPASSFIISFSQSDFSRKWLSQAAFAVAIITLAFSAFHFAQSLREDTRDSASKASDISVPQGGEQDVSNITREAWFGVAPEDQVAQAGDNTRLANFELKGISFANNAPFASAYIAEKGKDERYYHTGAPLPGGAGILQAIYRDHVTVSHNGLLTTLSLAGSDAPLKPGMPLANTTTEKSPFYALPPEKKPVNGPYVSPAELLKRFVSDPKALLAQAGLEPVTQGSVKGYRFNGEDAQGVFYRSGVQTNDIIMAVNGKPVGNPGGDRTLAPRLAFEHTLKLDIERSGQHITINYQVPQ